MEHSKIVTLGNGLKIELMRPDLGISHRVLNNNWMGKFTMHFWFGEFYIWAERHTITIDNYCVIIENLQEYVAALNDANEQAKEWQAEYENWKLNQKDHGI